MIRHTPYWSKEDIDKDLKSYNVTDREVLIRVLYTLKEILPTEKELNKNS